MAGLFVLSMIMPVTFDFKSTYVPDFHVPLNINVVLYNTYFPPFLRFTGLLNIMSFPVMSEPIVSMAVFMSSLSTPFSSKKLEYVSCVITVIDGVLFTSIASVLSVTTASSPPMVLYKLK